MPTDLLPCPLCGSNASFSVESHYRDSDTIHVECEYCGTRTPGTDCDIYCREKAADAEAKIWNQRAAPPRLPAPDRAGVWVAEAIKQKIFDRVSVFDLDDYRHKDNQHVRWTFYESFISGSSSGPLEGE